MLSADYRLSFFYHYSLSHSDLSCYFGLRHYQEDDDDDDDGEKKDKAVPI